MNEFVDTRNWNSKVEGVLTICQPAITKALQKCHDIINPQIVHNLSGPHYGEGGRGPATGTMPIPRLTSMLAQSYEFLMPEYWLSIYRSRGEIASYNKWVHDGTRRMPARKFIENPMIENKEKVMGIIEDTVLNSIRVVGQKFL